MSYEETFNSVEASKKSRKYTRKAFVPNECFSKGLSVCWRSVCFEKIVQLTV